MATPSLSLVALGDWPAHKLFTTVIPSGLRLSPEQHEAVTQAWNDARIGRDIDLFDGPLCRLEMLLVDDDGLHLHLSPTSYRMFIGTNVRHPQWAVLHGRQTLADPVGSSVVLRSSDGVLVFGRRSSRVALYPGSAHPFGGTIEPSPHGGAPDLLAEMLRELQEEIGITPGDVSDLRIIAVVEDRHLRQPELVYAAQTILTAEAITARLDLHEHTGCWLLPDRQADIGSALTSTQTITPVLAGALLAWGWRHFGDDWLNTHVACVNAERQPVARWG